MLEDSFLMAAFEAAMSSAGGLALVSSGFGVPCDEWFLVVGFGCASH